MKPRERRGGWCSGGERYSKTNDIAATRETGTRGRWRRKIKRGTRGKTDRSEGNALVGWGCGYLFCGEERNYFMGVDSDAVGNSGRMRHPSSAHPHWKWCTPIYYTTSSRLEPSYQLFIRFSSRSPWFFYLAQGERFPARSVPRRGTRFLACWIENGGL